MSVLEDQLRKDAAFGRVARDPGPPLDRDTYYCKTPDDDDLPEAELVERVQLGGVLALVWATVWCRKDSLAPAGSPVPWLRDEVFPWTVELHGVWPDAMGGPDARVGVAFSFPCPVDPRIPSPAADAAIRSLVARALLHEGQEGTLIDGERLDPHEHGEAGLEAVHRALYARAIIAQQRPHASGPSVQTTQLGAEKEGGGTKTT